MLIDESLDVFRSRLRGSRLCGSKLRESKPRASKSRRFESRGSKLRGSKLCGWFGAASIVALGFGAMGACFAQDDSLTPQTAPQTHWESFHLRLPPYVDQHLQDPVLIGAIDLHTHHGPDAYPRQWDAFEIAELAASRGMRGIVLKNHWTQTAGLAYLIRKYGAQGIEVFGSVALDTAVGGVNPQAVRYMADVVGGWGRVVWMPTHDSEHEVKFNHENRPFAAVSREGVLLPETLEVLKLIAERGLTLATGHVAPADALLILQEAKRLGIEHVIVTHPLLGEQYTFMSDDELRRAVELGGVIEITAGRLFRPGAARDHAFDVIRLVGPEHAVVSSDSGLTGLPNITDSLVMAAHALREAGFAEHDLDLMFKINPARLLGLPPPR